METLYQVTTHGRATSFKWQLQEAKLALLEAVNDLKAIQADPTYKFTLDDLKQMKNTLAAIRMLAGELQIEVTKAQGPQVTTTSTQSVKSRKPIKV